MIRNYLKVAWRNLVKNRVFSIINISGLAIGLSCFLLIALYLIDELSYDRFYEKEKNIYRIHSDIRFGGTDLHMPVSSDAMGAALKKDYPQVEEYTRIYANNGAKLVKKGDGFITEVNVAHVDSTFFNVFTLPVVAGDTKTALNEPNTVVITASAARKYFGTSDVVGKTIETREDSTLYKVTAVIADIPDNSHFKFDFLFSMDNVDYGWGNYLSHNFYTYLLLKKDVDYKAFEKNFEQYIEKYVVTQAKQFMQVNSMEEFKKAGNMIEYSLIPLAKIHLNSDRSFELRPAGNRQYVYIFSAVALFILLIACINFMNLTTARSAKRAKEVGIRKVLGTERRNLMGQFLTESTLMVMLSLFLAIGIAYLVLPLFNDLAGKSITLRHIFSPTLLPLLIALPFVVGLIAGSYPAFYLSSFRPIQVLKGKLESRGKKVGLRSVLVVFQFCISIVLIIGTIVVYKQLSYIRSKNLGFNKDQVLIINDTYVLDDKSQAFRNEMMNTPGVTDGTMSGYLPVASARNDNGFSKEAVMDAKNGFNMQIWQVDYDYINTLGMEIKQGRNFSRGFGSDSSAVIINESTASVLGYKDPIGQKIYTMAGTNGNQSIPYTIVGVVKNFHFESLRRNIMPLCMVLGDNNWLASFKVSADHLPQILAKAENTWKKMVPGMPFSYRFLDESFNEIYNAEQRVGKIALVFAVLAIFIACLGLFGLATYMAELRTKEIGIRKVMGASVNGIVRLLSKDFLRLVLIAFVVAVPAAWWFMQKWLQDFAYRINISWWVFAVAAGIAVFIALVTVSFQAIKTAIANPVKSLRTE